MRPDDAEKRMLCSQEHSQTPVLKIAGAPKHSDLHSCLPTQVCTHLGIDDRESDGHWKVDPCLQEGNDLCSTSWCCYDQHILQTGLSSLAAGEVLQELRCVLHSPSGRSWQLITRRARSLSAYSHFGGNCQRVAGLVV